MQGDPVALPAVLVEDSYEQGQGGGVGPRGTGLVQQQLQGAYTCRALLQLLGCSRPAPTAHLELYMDWSLTAPQPGTAAARLAARASASTATAAWGPRPLKRARSATATATAAGEARAAGDYGAGLPDATAVAAAATAMTLMLAQLSSHPALRVLLPQPLQPLQPAALGMQEHRGSCAGPIPWSAGVCGVGWALWSGLQQCCRGQGSAAGLDRVARAVDQRVLKWVGRTLARSGTSELLTQAKRQRQQQQQQQQHPMTRTPAAPSASASDDDASAPADLHHLGHAEAAAGLEQGRRRGQEAGVWGSRGGGGGRGQVCGGAGAEAVTGPQGAGVYGSRCGEKAGVGASRSSGSRRDWVHAGIEEGPGARVEVWGTG